MRLAAVLKRHLADPLFDALAEEADPSMRKFLLSVLIGFRSDILPEAVRRLNDKRWYVVRNMIYIIRECGGVKYVATIKALAKHEDKRLGIEAVKTLLHFSVPAASPYMRLYLQSKDLELRDQVVRLTGTYKVKEAVPYLLDIIERKSLLGTEWGYKASVVKALGEIGDTRALDTLKRLYESRNILYKAAMEELKVEIFRSLSNYPHASVKYFLERGLASKNQEIRAIAERLIQRRGKEDVPKERQ